MWTTPYDWSTGDKVTATRMNLVRDDLRFLYQPPECRVSGVGNMKPAKDASGNVTWTMVDWPNTVADNDMMRTLSGINQNEPAGAFVEVQTAGHYLVSAVIGFDVVQVDASAGSPPYPPLAHTLAVGVRNGPAGATAYCGYAIDCVGGGWAPPTIPILAAYSCLAGYQWWIDLYAPESAGDMVMVRAGGIPYFHITWIGGS